MHVFKKSEGCTGVNGTCRASFFKRPTACELCISERGMQGFSAYACVNGLCNTHRSVSNARRRETVSKLYYRNSDNVVD